MKLEALEQYYVEELRDLYDAEKQLLRALPRMAKAASHEQLKSALEMHAEQTQEQANRLEKILQKHGKNAHRSPQHNWTKHRQRRRQDFAVPQRQRPTPS